MAKNEFLPFGIADGANVLTNDEYSKLAARTNGFSSGVAKSQELNKVWRQASVIAATVAQFIVETTGKDVLDDGNLQTLQAGLLDAIRETVNANVPAASLTTAGITKLSNATDSHAENMAATPKAVRQVSATANQALKEAENALTNANTANQNAVNANDNANRRLDKAQNGADIPDKKAFVSNLGLEKTVELAANALDKRTGGTVSGAVTVGQLMTPALTIGSGGVYDGNRDAASFEGNNIEIRSWHGVGFKSTHNSPNDVTSIYFNTRNGDIAAQGSISSQGDIASQGNLSILKNASVKGKISADEGLIAGTASQNAILTPWGDLHGNTWGGWLSHWLNATFARKNSGVVSGKGWFKDESTGLIIQWGSESESNRNFSFPHMFSEACFVVLVTNSTSQGRSIDNAFGYPVNNSEFYAATKRENGIVNGFPVAWLAIGR